MYLCSPMKKVVCCCLMLFSAIMARGEYFCRVRNFATDNGLLQTHISNAVQDQTGFIWFATWNGLVRFDGNTFNTFKPILNSGGTIFSNRIYNIKRSANAGGLWCVSSDNRLYYFDTQQCLFTDVLAEIEAVHEKRVKVLTPLGKDVTWVTFKDQSCLRLVDHDFRNGYRYYPTGDKALMGASQIISITQDENANEWILTDRGAVCTTRRLLVKGLFHYVKSIGRQVFLVSKDGEVEMVDANGKSIRVAVVPKTVNYVVTSGDHLLIATDHGVWSYDVRRKRISQHDTSPAIYLYRDARQRIWSFGHDYRVAMLNLTTGSMTTLEAVQTTKGSAMKNPQLIMEDATGTVVLKPERSVLSYYDETTATLQPCRFYRGSESVAYEPTAVSKFFVDHQHNLWILQPHTVECISFNNTSFSHWSNPTRQEMRAIFRDSNGYEWLTDRSLSLYVSDGNHVQRFLSPNGHWKSSPVPFTKMPAYCFSEDREHRLWIGTKGDGLYLLTPRAGNSYQVEHFLNDHNDHQSLRSDSIYAILQAADGTMLLGSFGQGISTARRGATGEWLFRPVKDFPVNTKIRCMVEPVKGIFLIGTTNGIITADLRNAARPHYYHNVFRNEDWGLKGNDVMNILRHGDSWYACVFGSGISKILSTTLTSDTIHFRNYLLPPTTIADQIKTAASDGQSVWIFSEKTVSRFSPVTGSFSIFDRTNFIGDFNFAEGQPIVDGKRITAGTSDGLLTFHTDVVGSHCQPPHIVLTGIQYQNDMAIHPLNDLRRLEVSPDQRSFSLYLSALDFDERNAVRFRYRLEGFDRGWNYTSESQHAANYSSLPPGDYVLTIQATNGEGEWDENVRQINVHVIPRFVETVWFKLIILLLLVAVFLGMAYAIVYLSRMRRLLQRKYSLLMTVDEFSRDIRIEKEQQNDDADEQLFMKKSIAFFEDNISNSNFVIEDLARHLGMSRTAYYNKMKSITGLSPIDFIKQMRIKKALKLMEDSSWSITDIAYKVGFSDPKYFSKCFKAEMGMTPTQYLQDYSSSS